MADEDVENDDDAEQPKAKPKSSKKNLIILVVLALVLVILSVGGTIFALKTFSPQPQPVQEEEIVEEEAAPSKNPAIYYPLKPSLIVTYSARGRHRYAQVAVSLMFRDEEVVSAIELHKPMILNALNMVLSGQVYEELQTAEGKELVRLECLEKLQNIMKQELGKPGVEQVLFTDFVMQ